MYKHELTDEYKTLLRGVIDGSTPMVQCEGEREGYADAHLGNCVFHGYPWESHEQTASDNLNGDINVTCQVDDGKWVWRNALSDGQSIEAKSSFKSGAYTTPRHFKYRARVALEALRNRLDKGVL